MRDENGRYDHAEYGRRYRSRMKRQGFVKVEVWVPERNRESIKWFAEKLRKLYEQEKGK